MRSPRSTDLADLIWQLFQPEVKKQVYAEAKRGLSWQEVIILERMEAKDKPRKKRRRKTYRYAA